MRDLPVAAEPGVTADAGGRAEGTAPSRGNQVVSARTTIESAGKRMNFSPYLRTVSWGDDDSGRGGAGPVPLVCASTGMVEAAVVSATAAAPITVCDPS